uniref:Uncharacterized protein n=1 Tax=Oryza brachyantha TaxID=4533 RepID=J3MSB0_ORYBR
MVRNQGQSAVWYSGSVMILSTWFKSLPFLIIRREKMMNLLPLCDRLSINKHI